MFRTRALNRFFLRIFSFLGWHDDVLYKQSHVRHHSSTLHPPDDLEVVLPVRLHVLAFLRSAIIDPVDLYKVLANVVRHSLGRLKKGGVSSFGEHPSGNGRTSFSRQRTRRRGGAFSPGPGSRFSGT